MRFPEPYPILAIFARYAVVLVGMGCAAIGGGVLAGRYASPLRSPEVMSPLHLIWWQHYGWGLGTFFIVFGVGLFMYRASIKRGVLLGTRLQREHDRSRER